MMKDPHIDRRSPIAMDGCFGVPVFPTTSSVLPRLAIANV